MDRRGIPQLLKPSDSGRSPGATVWLYSPSPLPIIRRFPLQE